MDRADDAHMFLAALIEARGNWINSTDIDNQEGQKPKGRHGVRWDRVCKSLPGKIRIHIESARSKSFRIRLA
jgi:hypothetical protein